MQDPTPLQHPAVIYALALKDLELAKRQLALVEAQGQMLNLMHPQAVEALKNAEAQAEAAKAALPTADASALKVVA